MAQGSLRTMRSKVDVFPLYVFILANVLCITKNWVEKPNFKFASVYEKKHICIYHGYSFLCPSLPGRI